MLSKRFASLVLSLGAGLFLLVSGCGGGSSGPGAKDPLAMFYNGCQDGPVAFFANGDDKTGSIAYKAKTPFITLPFDPIDNGDIDITLAEPDDSIEYDAQAHTFQKDTSTLAAAVGVKNPPDTERLKRLKEIFFTIDRTAPIGNRSMLLFLHAFNRKSPFDTPPLVLQTFGDQPLFQTDNTDYAKITTLEVDSGTYKTNADPAKDTHWLAKDPDNDQVYAQITSVTLDPGSIYLVVVSGVENSNSNIKQTIQFVKIPTLAP